MANLPELSQFDSVYQIETTDPVQGGASGVTNTPLKNLTNRTRWLREQATFKTISRGVNANFEVIGDGNVNVNKASDLYGKIVPVYHNDPGGFAVGTITLLTSDLTADNYGTVVRFLGGLIDGVRVDIKVGATVLGSLFSTASSYIEVFFNGTTWVLSTDSLASNVGQVAAYAKNTAPQGWLKCNGAAISRTTYAALFAQIGTTFGAGNGSTTFNLPDLRGEFIRGWDDGRGVDSGRVFGSAQQGTIHAIDSTGVNQLYAAVMTSAILGSANAALVAQRTGLDYDANGATNYPNTTSAYSNGDGSGGFDYGVSRPRNVALLYCIKF